MDKIFLTGLVLLMVISTPLKAENHPKFSGNHHHDVNVKYYNSRIKSGIKKYDSQARQHNRIYRTTKKKRNYYRNNYHQDTHQNYRFEQDRYTDDHFSILGGAIIIHELYGPRRPYEHGGGHGHQH